MSRLETSVKFVYFLGWLVSLLIHLIMMKLKEKDSMTLLSRVGLLIIFGVWLFLSDAIALPPMNLPYGATPISHRIYDLHMLTFYLCVGIGVIVFGALMYSLIKFRKSRGVIAENTHEHLGIEIVWTVIPFLILVIMAIPATRLLMDI